VRLEEICPRSHELPMCACETRCRFGMKGSVRKTRTDGGTWSCRIDAGPEYLSYGIAYGHGPT